MYKAIIINILLLILIYTKAEGQEEIPNNYSGIYMELYGANLSGVGLGYEYFLSTISGPFFSLRAGLGLGKGETYQGGYPTRPLANFGGSFMLGGKANLEIGINLLINSEIDNKKLITEPLIGFRYQHYSNDVFFRLFIVPPVGHFEPESFICIPVIGLVFGAVLQ